MKAAGVAPREMATEDLVTPFGPEHPAVPGLRLLLTLDGEQVSRAEVTLGYRHRGLEWLAERGWDAAAAAAPRLDPLAPHAGAAALALAVEALAGVQPPPRARHLRVLALEIERVASHLGWLACGLALLELRPTARLAAQLQREVREQAARLAPAGFIVPGGVSADPGADAAERVPALAGTVRRGLAAFGTALGPPFGAGRLMERRLAGLAPLAAERALDAAASGPVLRASGVPHDLRAAGAHSAYVALYAELGFEPAAIDGGDALARHRLRLAEVGQALILAERAAVRLPPGATRVPVPATPPAGQAGGRVEGPRGEVAVTLVSDGANTSPRRVALRGPSLAHAALLPDLLAGCRSADLPLAVASLDLSLEDAER